MRADRQTDQYTGQQTYSSQYFSGAKYQRFGTLTGLVRHADSDIAVDADENGDPDGRGLNDEDEGQEVDEYHLVAVVVIRRVPAAVLDQVRDAEYRHDGDQHQRVGHRQHLDNTSQS